MDRLLARKERLTARLRRRDHRHHRRHERRHGVHGKRHKPRPRTLLRAAIYRVDLLLEREGAFEGGYTIARDDGRRVTVTTWP